MIKHVFCLSVMLSVPMSVIAQDDFRHVDEGRPIRIRDAYPIKFMEWEWEIGTSAELAEGGNYETAGVIEFKLGIARNFELGIETHSALTREAGVSRSGVEEFATHLLFNLNQEGVSMPAFAIRGDLIAAGVGAVGRQDPAAAIKGIATRTLGGWRAHVNAGYKWASALDGGDYWMGGVALDRALGLSSRVLLGDIYVEIPADGRKARVWLDFGSRLQMTKTLVLDAGISARLDEWVDGNSNIGITVGLSRNFGFGSLVAVPPYPNPRIN